MSNITSLDLEHTPQLIPYVFEAVAEQQAIRDQGIDPKPYRRALLAHLVLDRGFRDQYAARVINRAESEIIFHRREVESLLRGDHDA